MFSKKDAHSPRRQGFLAEAVPDTQTSRFLSSRLLQRDAQELRLTAVIVEYAPRYMNALD